MMCRAVALNGYCWQQRCCYGSLHGCAGVWRSAKRNNRSPDALSASFALAVAGAQPLTLGVAVVALIALIRHPLMPVYGEILLKVVSR